MQFYNLHTHKSTNNPAVLELVNQYPWEFDATIPHYSIGIHPWYINKERLETDLQTIDDVLALPHCLALGECGLDKRIEIPISLQIDVFTNQILLAEKHQKPLILHCVAAFQEIIALKKQLNITVPIIIHGFSKNSQIAKQLLDNGIYVSFGKYLLQNPELKTVFQAIPHDKFFLETDTVEETLEEVYNLAAKYRNCTLEEIQLQIKQNWQTVFGVIL